MRFDEVLIERYGLYSSKQLNLTGAPGLVVLYGPNEAGKSTTLSAVVDLLYGIPIRTPRAQVYGGPAMAISAKLSLQFGNGQTLTVKRTKGTARTLTDGQGSALDESVLAAHLGPNDRDRFLALFALDHQSLRTGGKQLLDAKGDIGRMIVEAGGGLSSLAAHLDRMGSRAEALYASRRSANRAFYAELDRFNEADKQVRSGLLTVDAYERAHKESRSAAIRLEEIRVQLRRVRENHKSLERMAKVCPLLHQLERTQEALRDYNDLPQLPTDFAAQVKEAFAFRASARQSLEQAVLNLQELRARVEALHLPQSILDRSAEILDAATWGVHVSKERKDREERKLEMAKSRSRLDGLRRLTGVAPEADIALLMPSTETLARVRALAAEATRLETEIRGAEMQLKESSVHISQLQNRQAERKAQGYHVPPGFNAATLAGLDSASRDYESRCRQVEMVKNEISRRAKSLGFDSVDELTALKLPDDVEVHAEIQRVANTADEVRGLKELIVRESRRKSANSAAVAGLRAAGEAPTDQAIAAARQLRRSAWDPIRETYLRLNDAVKETQIEQRAALAKAFEERTADADTLVDRRAMEAQRVADLKLAEQELIEAEFAILSAQAEIGEIDVESRKATAAWTNAWPDATRLHLDVIRLKPLLQERSAIILLVGQLSSLQAESNRVEDLVRAGMELLREAETRFGICDTSEECEHLSINTRVRAVTERAKLHEDEYSDYRAAGRLLEGELARREAAERAVSDLSDQKGTWAKEWSEIVTRLHLKPDASPETATSAAAEWAAAHGVLDAIHITQQRLDKMDRDEQRLQLLIDRLETSAGTELPSDVVAAAELLKRRLDEALRIQSAREALEQQAVGLAPARDKAERDVGAAEKTIADLCAAGGCDEGELSTLAERCQERAACWAQVRQTEQRLLDSGDQFPVELLREQLEGRELDEIAGAIQQEQDRERVLEEQRDHAVKEEERLKVALQQFSSSEDLNRPVAERESAAAALRQIVSDYLELSLARELIEEAMAVVREEQQDPLLARAGALFRKTTNGAFTGIRADVDEAGKPSVVGVRCSGEHVSIDTMSDGTGDQLFLAFRVAAVEQYCASAEPLPFLADDLLVHFDDGRSLAALELLAELGKTTQVLLFTHHSQIRDAAADLVTRGLAGVVELV